MVPGFVHGLELSDKVQPTVGLSASGPASGRGQVHPRNAWCAPKPKSWNPFIVNNS